MVHRIDLSSEVITYVQRLIVTLSCNDRMGIFAAVGESFGMQWATHDVSIKSSVLLMASKCGHCLNKLLYRYRVGVLAIEIAAIVSNHRDFYRPAAANNVTFHYLSVNPNWLV